jgi:hypothetical protein
MAVDVTVTDHPAGDYRYRIPVAIASPWNETGK